MPSKLSTEDIVRHLADDHQISLAESREIIDKIFKKITDSVAKKNQVSITKFGTFEPYRSKAYTGRNPQTGKAIKVPAKNRVKFRPFTGFKSKL